MNKNKDTFYGKIELYLSWAVFWEERCWNLDA